MDGEPTQHYHFSQIPLLEWEGGFFLSLPGHCNSSTSTLRYLLQRNTWLKHCQTPYACLTSEQTLGGSCPEPGGPNLGSPHPSKEPHGMGRIEFLGRKALLQTGGSCILAHPQQAKR